MTPGFNSPVLRTDSADGHNFTLVNPVIFTRPNGEVITVPAGTTSDGASTPRLLWRVLPPFGAYWPAAFLHDYLYRATTKPKVVCDTILKEAMLSLGVDEVTAETIYQGVNLGGSASFAEDRAAQQLNQPPPAA